MVAGARTLRVPEDPTYALGAAPRDIRSGGGPLRATIVTMERAWLLETLALTLRETDFLDPALRGEPDARERGVRLEVRPLRTAAGGSLYSSPSLDLGPAVCRVDVLESAPGAADRVHWHPVMHDGEPGERVFDPAISADPLGWLEERLRDLGSLLVGVEPTTRAALLADEAAVAALAAEVSGRAAASLTRLREPWDEVEHDERGMAPLPSPA